MDISTLDTVYIGPSVRIGKNPAIEHHCKIDGHITIGNNVTIGHDCELYGSLIIGDGVSLDHDCHIGSPDTTGVIERDTYIGPNCEIFAEPITHMPITFDKYNPEDVRKSFAIGAGTCIGASCIIAPGLQPVSIGAGCNIAPWVSLADTTIGDNCIIYYSSGVHSANVGKRCIVWNTSRLLGAMKKHIEIGEGTEIAPYSFIRRSIAPHVKFIKGMLLHEKQPDNEGKKRK